MKEINRYYESFTDTSSRIDYLKYGILNDYGLNPGHSKECYNEEKIIKTRCNHKG